MQIIKLILILIFIASFQITAFAQVETVEGFYIEGEINGQKVSYVQKNISNVAPSNHYYPNYAIIHLQAYDRNDTQSLGISIFDLKLDRIKTPYKIRGSLKTNFNLSTGTSGYDIKNGNCGGLDNGCIFGGSSKSDQVQATITKIDYENKIIEGVFSGKLILTRTGIVRGNYPNIFIAVKNGKFKLKFRLARV